MQGATIPSSPSKRRAQALKTENRIWDPGNLQIPTRNTVTAELYSLLLTATVGEIDGAEEASQSDATNDSRTELDSHANMPVVGRNSFIISDTGKIADVKAYSPE